DRGEHAFGGGLVEGVMAMESPRGIAERQRLAAQGRALDVRPAAVLLRPHEQRAHVGDGRLQLAHPDFVHPGFLQRGEGFAKNVSMPTTRLRARRTTIRAILDTAIELEKRTMALYVGFVKAFPRPEEVRNFWFTMARHEAGHCGALALVECIVETDQRGAAGRPEWFVQPNVWNVTMWV